MYFFQPKKFGILTGIQTFIHIVMKYKNTLKIIHMKLEVYLIIFKN
jgi:hypothetical protein